MTTTFTAHDTPATEASEAPTCVAQAIRNAARADDKSLPLLVLLQPLVNPGFPAVPFRLEPLSLMVIAGLTPRDKWRVKILDGDVVQKQERLVDPEATLVGITLVQATQVSGFKAADAYRKLGIPVIIGGPGVALEPETAAQHADSIVIGEVEGRWEQILEDALAKRLKPVYRLGQATSFAGTTPARDLIPHYRWRYFGATLIQTTRGCPHICPFCAPAVFYGQKLRHRPVADVVAEIAAVKKKYGRNMFGFTDDNLAGNRTYARELFTALIPLKIGWGGQACIYIARDLELLDLAKRSGCRSLLIGLETTEQDSMDETKKGLKVDDYPELIRRLQDRDIMIIATFTIGHDHDDDATYDRVLNYCRTHRLDFPLFMTLQIHPGIPLYNQMKAAGRLYDDPAGISPFRAAYQPAKLTRAEIPRRLADLYDRYYNWRFILGNLWHWLIRGRFRRFASLIAVYGAYFSFVRKAARPPKGH